MSLPTSFNALRIDAQNQQHQASVVKCALKDLTAGDVIIKNHYSSINYKDALAGLGKARILRQYPLNGGIDCAGFVVQSKDKRFKEGDAVICTGSGLSETLDGGFSEYLRLPASQLVALPKGLSLKEAMVIGTAGFTAALGLHRMMLNGQHPDMGSVVVTGATGGVGMLACDIFSQAGFEIEAVSGKTDKFDFLTTLGAASCMPREALDTTDKPMVSARFAGAMDTVGGTMLAHLLPTIHALGNVATCGNVAGIKLETTVMPFIIRGVNLLGVASSGCPMNTRRILWQRLGDDWKPQHLDSIHQHTVTLDNRSLAGAFAKMLAGTSFGRTLVSIQPES